MFSFAAKVKLAAQIYHHPPKTFTTAHLDRYSHDKAYPAKVQSERGSLTVGSLSTEYRNEVK